MFTYGFHRVCLSPEHNSTFMECGSMFAAVQAGFAQDELREKRDDTIAKGALGAYLKSYARAKSFFRDTAGRNNMSEPPFTGPVLSGVSLVNILLTREARPLIGC
jgi:hypothetical protein